MRRREKEHRGRETTEERDAKVHVNKARRERFVEVTGEPRADTHGRKVEADDEGKLGDRVAEHVARERAGEELVDEPAGGQQKDIQKEQRRSRTCDRRRGRRLGISGEGAVVHRARGPATNREPQPK